MFDDLGCSNHNNRDKETAVGSVKNWCERTTRAFTRLIGLRTSEKTFRGQGVEKDDFVQNRGV